MGRLYSCDLGEPRWLYVVAASRTEAVRVFETYLKGEGYEPDDPDLCSRIVAVHERTRGYDPEEWVEIEDLGWEPASERPLDVTPPPGHSGRVWSGYQWCIYRTYRAQALVWAEYLTVGKVIDVCP